MAVLGWMVSDTEERGNWKGWASVFKSIPRLRENGCQKFINARALYTKRHGSRRSHSNRELLLRGRGKPGDADYVRRRTRAEVDRMEESRGQ